MKTSETIITYEMIDAWTNKYAKEQLIRNHIEEFEELKENYRKELMWKYDII